MKKELRLQVEDNYNIDDILQIDGRQYAIVKRLDDVFLLVRLDNPVDILVGKIKERRR